MDHIGLFEGHQRGENLLGEALDHHEGQASKLVLCEYVEQGQAEQLEHQAHMTVVTERVKQSHNVSFVVGVVHFIQQSGHLYLQQSLCLIRWFVLYHFYCHNVFCVASNTTKHLSESARAE